MMTGINREITYFCVGREEAGVLETEMRN